MKSMSVLAAVSIAVLAVACKKDEPVSETSTTGAPVVQEQRAVQPQVTTGTTTTGTDLDNTATTTSNSKTSMQKAEDAGVATDWPSPAPK